MKKLRKQAGKKKARTAAHGIDVRQFVLDWIIGAGLQALEHSFEDSVLEVCGSRYQRRSCEAPRRWGRQPGELVLGGRRVRVMRPRVRQGGREVIIPAYQAFQNEDPLHERALEQMLVGVSTRKYGRSLEAMAGLPVSGTSKSAVSRRFVAATARQVQALLAKPLHGKQWTALMLDGLRFGQHVILVALGIDADGYKHLLGLWEGATENAAVCRSLLSDLVDRGLPADRHLLVVMDGAKALRKTVDEVFARNALVQRCQVHKQRNVLDHLPEHKQAQVRSALRHAYRAESYAAANEQLQQLGQSLSKTHPGAAASLKEGLEETLTVKRLGLDGFLERSLATTNPIENLNGVARTITRRVKRCADGQTALRWVCAAMLDASHHFKRLKGHGQISKLIVALHDLDTQDRMTTMRKAG